jgi:beta-glucanase (GH16 family)
MKMPYGQGMWPAFFMLGGNSWPNTGEIDVMENLGREPSIVHGTIHGPDYSGAAGRTASYTLPGSAKFSDDFHAFAIEWETNAIRWYVDGTLYSTKTPADTKGNNWVFDHGFFIILNRDRLHPCLSEVAGRRRPRWHSGRRRQRAPGVSLYARGYGL